MVTPVLIKQVTEPLGGSEKIEKEQFEWVLDSLESREWSLVDVTRQKSSQAIHIPLIAGGWLPFTDDGDR